MLSSSSAVADTGLEINKHAGCACDCEYGAIAQHGHPSLLYTACGLNVCDNNTMARITAHVEVTLFIIQRRESTVAVTRLKRTALCCQ